MIPDAEASFRSFFFSCFCFRLFYSISFVRSFTRSSGLLGIIHLASCYLLAMICYFMFTILTSWGIRYDPVKSVRARDLARPRILRLFYAGLIRETSQIGCKDD